MLKNVGERFVDGQEQVVARLRQWAEKAPVRQSSVTFDARFSEIFLGILPDVGEQMVERIILRVDGPDHFIERLKHLAEIVGYRTHPPGVPP